MIRESSDIAWEMQTVSWGGNDGPDPDCPVAKCLDTIEITASKEGDIFSPTGAVFFADALDVGVINSEPNVLFSASLTASGIASLTINHEELVVTPEPSSLLLLVFGLAGLGYIRKFRSTSGMLATRSHYMRRLAKESKLNPT